MLALMFFQFPEEVKELEKQIRQISNKKDDCIRSQDFEKVQFLIFHVTGFVFNSNGSIFHWVVLPFPKLKFIHFWSIADNNVGFATDFSAAVL